VADDPDLLPAPVPPLTQVLPLVAVGGALGALARYGLASAVPPAPSALPVATLVTNVAGCLLLGLLVGRLPQRVWLRAFAGTGVLGGFTTFSTFAVETDRLVGRAPGTAGLYLVLSLGLGVGAALVGLRLGRR
jgi:fluoride exporter